jgi:hypothetical protein
MRDALQALLREASDAKRSADFWRAAAGIVSQWAGGARLTIAYKGLNEAGTVAAGQTTARDAASPPSGAIPMDARSKPRSRVRRRPFPHQSSKPRSNSHAGSP